MQGWIIQIMNQFGYIGVLLLIAIENIFPPIPSEVILTFGGFMTTYTNMTIWGVIVFSTAGSLLGAIVLYAIGRFFSPKKFEQLLDGKWGKILHLKKEDVFRASEWFAKRGKPTVFFCRFIPVIRSLISIPAGMAGMNLANFLILTTLGSVIWNAVLVYLGAIAGASWGKIASYFDAYSNITIIVIGILFVLSIIILFIRNHLKKQVR